MKRYSTATKWGTTRRPRANRRVIGMKMESGALIVEAKRQLGLDGTIFEDLRFHLCRADQLKLARLLLGYQPAMELREQVGINPLKLMDLLEDWEKKLDK